MADTLQIILLALILIVSLAAPVIVILRLRAQQRAETERLIARMEQALGSSVKFLEVRGYYDQMSAEFKKMLDEAFREGNRFRQDHIRRLIERLEQLKARTLDKTVRMLDQPEGQQGQGQFRRRHHRGGRRHRPPAGQPPNAPPGYQPPAGQRPNPPSPPPKPPAPPPPKPPAQS